MVLTREHEEEYGYDATSYFKGFCHVSVEFRRRSSHLAEFRNTSPPVCRRWACLLVKGRHLEVNFGVKQIVSNFSVLVVTHHFGSQSGSKSGCRCTIKVA